MRCAVVCEWVGTVPYGSWDCLFLAEEAGERAQVRGAGNDYYWVWCLVRVNGLKAKAEARDCVDGTTVTVL